MAVGTASRTDAVIPNSAKGDRGSRSHILGRFASLLVFASQASYTTLPSLPVPSTRPPCFHFCPIFFLLAFKSCQEEGEKNMSSTASGVHSLNIRVGTPFRHSTNGTGPDSFLLSPRRTQARARGSVFGTVTHMRE